MRWRSIFIILVAMVLLVSGCERISKAILPTPSLTKPPKTTSTPTLTRTPSLTPTPVDPIGVDASALNGLNINIWYAWGSPQREMLEAQIAEFNRRNPWNVTVTSQPFPDWNSLYEAVNQAADSGGLPDLVVALPEYALSWDAQGNVVDLTEYVNHPKWGLTPDMIADIPAVFWSQDRVGAKRLGLPAERSTRLLFYNARWARELGFESPPSNEQGFRTQACAANKQFRSDSIMANDGYGGWILDADPQSALSWLNAFGGGVMSNQTYLFNTKENTAALTFLKNLFDDSCAWIYTGLDRYAPLADRKALFISGDLSELSDQANAFVMAKNNDEWEAIPFPGADGTSILAYGPSFTVMKSNPERQLAAWLFARWMLKPDIQAQWVKATGMLPLLNSEMNLLAQYASSHPQWTQAVDLLNVAKIQPQTSSWRTVKYTLGDGTYSLFRLNLPASDIPSVLDEMQSTADELSK
jgi:multiple sugar transport system substrate-binding protein